MPELNPGLSAAEVAERIAAGKVNRPPADAWRDYGDIFRRNTLTLFNALVTPAAIALFLLADYRGAWAVSGMAVANTIIGLTHELRAKRHLDRLSLLGEAKVRVRRGGVEQTIRSGEVVPGDLVLLAAGETVVADGTLVSASYLELDEALLTGESDPVARIVKEQVKSGSVCVAGEGMYLTEQTGSDAFAERIAAAARKYQHSPGPTQHTLDQLVKWLTGVAVLLSLGYLGLYIARGFPATDLVQMVAATITSMVPQGLVLLTTLVFVLSATRLSHHGAVVQRLAAVEGLAAVEVLCTDKTGTLTSGRLALDHLKVFFHPEPMVRQWLGTFSVESIDRQNKSIEALREALATVAAAVEVVDQLPFQSHNRYSAFNARMDGQSRLFVLGSVEALRTHLSDTDWMAVETEWKCLLPSGLRLILFADGFTQFPLAGKLPEVPLRPLALIALRDELRPDVISVLADLAAQGIRLKVVSGDHPQTVQTTVAALGSAFSGKSIITGNEWMAAPNQDSIADNCDVFGRMSPEQKLTLVRILRQASKNIGMIGDGVNDILPIKQADFGVAMGSGSPATKAVADIVLESNEFSSLPTVLGEGRRVVRNVRQAAKLFLLKNVYTIALVLVAVGCAGLPFPYLPQQVTLLNALTIGGPALLILTGRSGTSMAIKSPFFADVGWFLLIAGGAISIVSLAVYLGAMLAWGHETGLARTLLLSTLILAGVGNAIVATNGDWRLVLWSVFAIAVLFITTTVAPLVYFFDFVPLHAGQWILVLVAATCAVLPAIFLNPGGAPAGENR